MTVEMASTGRLTGALDGADQEGGGGRMTMGVAAVRGRSSRGGGRAAGGLLCLG
jgi:hypothetical protein